MSKYKKILITGATSGVGFEAARRLLAEGHEVYVTGRSEPALSQLRELGAEAIRLDLTIDGAVDQLIAWMKTPDVIIISAGVATFALAHETTDAQMDDMFTVNVTTPIRLTQRILPVWMERKEGHFLFIGSQAGKVATPKAAVYAATKHALIGYTDALRMEVAASNIKVSVIHPGPIDTSFLDKADAGGKYRDSVGSHLLSVEEVAKAVVNTVHKPKRQVDLPKVMSLTSKLHTFAPNCVERLGKKFFMKKMQ